MEKQLLIQRIQYCAGGVSRVLGEYNAANRSPIIVCVGSDLVLGDSLGPLVGTLLKQKGVGTYIYGTLNCPITAKEIEYAKTYLKQLHPESFIIAIDAAVGASDDIGLITQNRPPSRTGRHCRWETGRQRNRHVRPRRSRFVIRRAQPVYKMATKTQKESRIISTNELLRI
ncbi:MAG: DUF1256 domain-containing protein [Christensenellaceae bacterium]